MIVNVRDGYGEFCQPTFECGCCEMLVFRVCYARQNLYVLSLYLNPDLEDQIFNCLLSSMASVQVEDVSASFRFVGDLIKSGWVLQPQNVMALQPFTLQLCLVVISWSSTTGPPDD